MLVEFASILPQRPTYDVLDYYDQSQASHSSALELFSIKELMLIQLQAQTRMANRSSSVFLCFIIEFVFNWQSIK